MTNREKFKEVFGKDIKWSDLIEPQRLALKSAQINGIDCMEEWLNAEYKEPSSSVIPNNPIRYIVLQVQISSTSCTICICHGIFNDFYKAVGKCVCLIGDSDDDWIKSAYKLTDRSDMWRTETENGFGWYRKYEHENPEIVVQETWLVIDGDVEL